jgi:hypothetical protein
MRWFWHWWLRRPDTTAEELLKELEDRDEHMQELGAELRRVRARNHFSDLVNEAIHHAARGAQ